MTSTTELVADSSQHGRVIDQDPGPGETLFPGDTVEVTIGEFVAPTTTTVPTTTTTTTTTTSTTDSG
jgi:beta-lactam-binding protein with PASTA domain